jgi:hypothetical protein
VGFNLPPACGKSSSHGKVGRDTPTVNGIPQKTAADDGPGPCYQKLFGDHFMVLAENVFGYKRFVVVMFMMCIVCSVNI